MSDDAGNGARHGGAIAGLDLGLAIERCAAAVISHAEHLTKLDQAIGDGDHGLNMKRGFEALLAQKDELAALPPDHALQKVGMTLVSKVGGASGPLYGSLALGVAAALKAGEREPAALLEAGVAKVKQRGKSDAGAKTMLDLLVPVQEALAKGAGVAEVKRVADEALEATKPMVALRGRASFLGERSAGHVDPGAASSHLMVRALCQLAGEER